MSFLAHMIYMYVCTQVFLVKNKYKVRNRPQIKWEDDLLRFTEIICATKTENSRV